MLASLAKLILGFVLAIAVLLGTGITIALYFVNRTGVAPEKPMFANDYPQKPKNTKNTVKSKSKTAPKPTPTEIPTEIPTESPTPSPTPTELPPNAYKATVTWSSGLRLRSKPEQEAESVGGVAYNKEIIVLEESSDGKWKKIRVGDSNQEGWVKSANLKKSDE
ncbi:SH3 domain-containing protein [Anabaena sp. FACHB-1237]|uniref:SH3 domain-containing protein n=1 Tax=Anabaena sp. FACHB-1237 TaxID=2692769 RepID=UPI0016803CC4|nr:SH3 domain-containing protein [Anabaena sp. FACHB-1237]MBD2137846.1 SH3 domain-containing protein [Anabaena sp. FACHB-1237]